MTVASQIKQTHAMLQGVEATISTYANHHPDKITRELMLECREKISSTIQELSTRIKEIENEEGQYKGF
ncbi:hypothetical protein [Alkaliphilus serpentinus]|uniref:DUF1657 domain-containing protein n=1 Tax=Alkaliphilus serpentinus TaxID=1482731 RepID=A0A833HQ50_9FIRM|nr:hypothetical protein [Alkaliphilus serpentinus]KAB3531492.1 hypothetical protein F8153_04755 [Alkaliphilus serpentinus]